MPGIYAADGSQRVTLAGSEASSALDDLLTSIGSPDDAAWNGTDGSASLIAVQKAIYAAVSV